ncbi:MAG: SUMF1/EgtB/PvdO family nonheme iron enzyme [Polyangiaceae bacterium]|nr:SUMF1/EgtB/PvdO family nonheme iron enzyme [Polyangiaceae bacterium]
MATPGVYLMNFGVPSMKIQLKNLVAFVTLIFAAVAADGCGKNFDNCAETYTCPPKAATGRTNPTGAGGSAGTAGLASLPTGGTSSKPSVGGSAGTEAVDVGGPGGTTGMAGAPAVAPIGILGEACAPNGAYACAGVAQKGKLICQGGHWASNGTCDGPSNCDTSAINLGSCQAIVPECAGKAPGALSCQTNNVIQCGTDLVSSTSVKTCASPTPLCSAGACVTPSCDGLPNNCGPMGNESCCESPLVEGGTFNRGNATDGTATVSAFRLDKYEITVGRFRKFVDAWIAGWRPAAGAGKHAHLNNGSGLVQLTGTLGSSATPATAGAFEPGWDAAWAANIAGTQSGWNANLSCDATHQTWSITPSLETLPINCASWYELEAFCIWDGGFIPTEAEWSFAAVGGNSQRAYPWGADAPDASHAIYNCNYSGRVSCDLAPVGSASLGNGKYGQADLAGNLREWTWDFRQAFMYTECSCSDFVERRTASAGVLALGGDYNDTQVPYSDHFGYVESSRNSYVGARCARIP